MRPRCASARDDATRARCPARNAPVGDLLMRALCVHNSATIMALTLLLVIVAASVNAVLLASDRRLHERR